MKHRILLLGLGFWGSRWLKLILGSPRCQLAGLAGSEAELAEACATHGINPALSFTDFREAIEKTDAEVAVVVLPARLHFEADSLALAAGMNVITEKPLAMDMPEAEKLLALKTQKYPEQKFMASQNYRWRPHNQTIKRALAEGKIGRLESILLEFRQQEDLQGFRAGLAHPLLEDMAIHHFDLLRFFAGANCARVTASAWRPSWSLYEGKPNTEAILEMENGVHVAYSGSWAARGKETSWDGNITLTGEKGCLTLDANDVVRFYPHQKAQAVVLDMAEQAGEALPPAQMELTEMAYGLDYFLNCVEKDEVPETTLEDNIKSYAMVTACLESSRLGQAVAL